MSERQQLALIKRLEMAASNATGGTTANGLVFNSFKSFPIRICTSLADSCCRPLLALKGR
jgi:hypothetical protein